MLARVATAGRGANCALRFISTTMKTILVMLVLACATPLVANPAAEKQAERQRYQEERRREAEERAYRQLLIEYLAQIANQRR